MSIHLDNYPKYWSERGKEKDLSFKKACEFLDYLYEDYEGYVAFDTETENLNKIHGNRLVSLQFAIDDKKGYVICIDKPYTEFSSKELKIIKKKLVRLFESDKGNIIWLMHNAQFDIAQVVAQLKVKWVEEPVYDTQLFIHVLDENLVGSGDYSPLKKKAADFFGFNLYEKEAIEARGEGNLLALPKKSFVTYAGMDAYVTYRMFLFLKEYAKSIDYWKKAQRILKWIYSPAVKSFSRISQNGFYIDKKQLKWLLSDESPVLGRLDEIKQYYFKDPKVQAVNKELSLANNNGVSSVFGYKTKWIFDMNKPDHRKALFFTSKKGYKLKKINGFSTDDSFQQAYKDSVEIVKVFSEEQELKKLFTSYMKPIARELMNGEGDTIDGRVHPSFQLNGTVTGRISAKCIRKGTYIEVVRDVSKYPKGIKIEDVKPGDLVYCYDKNCKPTIRRVKSVVCNGKKELVRIKWRSSYNHLKGHLDCTPDHRIRLVTGDYIRAYELEKGDSILSMHRYGDSISFTKYSNTVEHRFVYRKLFGKIPEGYDIHHIDGNHFNNVPSNLECISHSEHSVLHDNEKWSRPGYRENMSAKMREYCSQESVRKHKSIQATIQGSDPEVRKYRSKCAKRQWKNKDFRDSMTGVNSPVYRPLEENFKKLLFKYKGNVAEYARKLNWDWGTLRSKIKNEGINADAIKLRFGGDGRRLTKKRIKKAIRICGSDNIRAISLYLHIVPFRLLELLAFYKIKCGDYVPTKKEKIRARLRLNINFKNNHKVIRVKKLKFKDYVYDIEVEGCHNFIANGLDVHNCPNVQQIPRSDTYAKKAIKCMYAVEPHKGRCLFQADFCANEIRFWGLVSEDPHLCKAFNDSFKKGQEFRDNPTDEKLAEEAHLLGDIHKQTASMMFDVPVNKVDKGMRQNSKSLSLGIMYQRGTHSVANMLGISFEEAQAKVDKFNHKFPVGCQWAEEQKKFVKKHGYVESPIGRRRNLQQEIAIGKSYIEKSKQYPFGSAKATEFFRKGNAKIASAERFSVNAPIQGIANDVAMISSAMLNEYIIKHDLDWYIVNTVHDSVVLDIPITDIEKVAKVTRKLFTIKNKEYMEKHFQWKMNTHVDIDMEISQWREKECKKCGKHYMYGINKCECGCKEYKTIKLNSGYGNCVGWDESDQQLEIIKKGLVEE
jgi:DNA polymerase I-like protein with 3'-5' exonuclease and polymerase domains